MQLFKLAAFLYTCSLSCGLVASQFPAQPTQPTTPTRPQRPKVPNNPAQSNPAAPNNPVASIPVASPTLPSAAAGALPTVGAASGTPQNITVENTDPALVYTPPLGVGAQAEWQVLPGPDATYFSGGNCTATTTRGATVAFTFYGSAIYVLMDKNVNHSPAMGVTVSSTPPQTTTINLRGPETPSGVVFSATNLNPAVATTITLTDTDGLVIGIDAFFVTTTGDSATSPPPAPPAALPTVVPSATSAAAPTPTIDNSPEAAPIVSSPDGISGAIPTVRGGAAMLFAASAASVLALLCI